MPLSSQTYCNILNAWPYQFHNNQRTAMMEEDQPSRIQLSRNQISPYEIERRRGLLERVTSKECPICTILINKSESIGLPCEHTCCKTCFQKYLRGQLNSLKEFSCFTENCKVEISPYLCSQYLQSEQEIQKVSKIYSYAAVAKNQHIRLCPKEKCGGFLDIDKKPVTCSYCGSNFCGLCLLKEHQGQCEKKQLQRFDELKYKKCKGCKRQIEKNQGCKHMKCLCKYQFCFECTEQWSANHKCKPPIKVVKKQDPPRQNPQSIDREREIIYREPVPRQTPILLCSGMQIRQADDASKKSIVPSTRNQTVNESEINFSEIGRINRQTKTNQQGRVYKQPQIQTKPKSVDPQPKRKIDNPYSSRPQSLNQLNINIQVKLQDSNGNLAEIEEEIEKEETKKEQYKQAPEKKRKKGPEKRQQVAEGTVQQEQQASEEKKRFIVYDYLLSTKLKTVKNDEIFIKRFPVLLLLFLLLFPLEILIKVMEIVAFIVSFFARSLYRGPQLFYSDYSPTLQILLNIFLMIYCVARGVYKETKQLVADASLYKISILPLIRLVYLQLHCCFL